MKNINIEYIDIDELKFAEYNPRKASKKEWEDLKKSIQKFGFIDPVIVNNADNRKNIIIGGHFRVKVAKEMGIKKVPVVYLNIPDIEKEKELNLRLNKNTGEWDWDLLANFDIDFLKDIGFDEIKFDEIKDIELEEVKETSKDNIIIYNEYAVFSSNNKFGIPELREDMLSNFIPSRVYGRGDIIEPEKTLFVFKTLTIKEECYKGCLAFYVDDYHFESCWQDAVKFIERYNLKRWKAVLTPDFSLWRDDPYAVQLWNIYRARWVARFWQEAGIKVIPSLNWSDEKSYEFAFLGIPKNAPVVSVQCRTTRDKKGKEYFINGIKKAIETLTPKNVIIYGSENENDWIELPLREKINYIFLPSWTKVRNDYLGWNKKTKKEGV